VSELFIKDLYKGRNSQTIADMCVNIALIESLGKLLLGIKFCVSHLLNNGDIYILVKKMA
jgi:hypothetical protein